MKTIYICISVKLDPFRCPASDRKSPPQRRISSLNICGKEVDLARNLFHKQRIRHQKSINIQQSFRLGRHATLYRERHIKKEDFKRRDRRRSFSISLVFIRQFWNRVCKRDSVIFDALKFIPRETVQDERSISPNSVEVDFHNPFKSRCETFDGQKLSLIL